jgi:RNA polymerase sigma-70 factor, ECF subfamily
VGKLMDVPGLLHHYGIWKTADRSSQRDAAMNEIIRRLQPCVRVIAMNMTKSMLWSEKSPRDTADDITSDALARFHRHFVSKGRIPNIPTIEAWFCTVVRNLIRDRQRASMSRPRENLEDNMPDYLITIEETQKADRRMTILSAMHSLSSTHQEILLLVYWEGFTIPQAAAKLDVPLGTAKSRIYYAHRRLRDALRRDCDTIDIEDLVNAA